MLQAGQLDPSREALVPLDAPFTPMPGGQLRQADIREFDSEHLRVEVPNASHGGWLVLANSYSPDWHATVDGVSRTVYPTDFAAMGLPLGPGSHRVDFTLSHEPFWVAVGLSILGLAVLYFLWLPWPRGAKRSRTA